MSGSMDHGARLFDSLARALLREAGVGIVDDESPLAVENGLVMLGQVGGERYFFKAFPAPDLDQLHAEVALVNFLRGQVEFVPEPFHFDDGWVFLSRRRPTRGVAMIGTRQIHGRQPDDSSPELLRSLALAAADLHVAASGFAGGPRAVTDYQRLLRFCCEQAALLADAELLARVEENLRLGVDDRPLIPIHGDLRFENVLVADGQFRAFIDFSDVRRSHAEDDLGRLLQYLSYTRGVPVSDLQALIEHYQARRMYRLSPKNLAVSICFHVLFRYSIDRLERDPAPLRIRLFDTLDLARRVLSWT